VNNLTLNPSPNREGLSPLLCQEKGLGVEVEKKLLNKKTK
jgi:hypothetical protein